MSQFLDLTGLEILWDKIKTKFERLATDRTMGYIKIGYSSSGKNYAVQLDANGQAYVNVPWTNNDTTYSVATADKLGLVKIGYSSAGKNYAVQLDDDDKMYVNVPWTDTNTTYTFTPTNPTLSWGTSTSIGTIGGTTFKVGLPANPNTDTKVTSVENHYPPEEDIKYGLSASADTAENITGSSKGISVLTGLKRDAAGHIVGVASRKLYSTDTNTKVTSVGNHYTPSGGSAATLTASGSTLSFGGAVITGITQDAAGHITAVATSKLPSNPNTDRSVTDVGYHYIPAENDNSAIIAANGDSSNVTGTTGVLNVVTGLKRDAAGHVVGVVSKNIYSTDTKVTSVGNHYTPAENTGSALSAGSGTVTSVIGNSTNGAVNVVTGLKRDAAGHVVGVVSKNIYSTDTNTKVTSVGNHYTPAENIASAINAADGTTTDITGTTGVLNVVTGLKRDAAGHVVGVVSKNIYSTDNNTTYSKITADELTAGSATGSRVVQPSVLGPWVKSQIDSKIAVADAMIYKGTLGTGGTITALPASHSTGWTYKVIKAGTYAGVNCEIGDMVICLTDGTTADDSHWTVVQNNIDGAVIGPTSAGANTVAIFDEDSGKVIKSSGYTIASSVPSGAKFTDTDTKVTSVSNHYTPAADNNAALSANASSSTSATWGGTDLVTGVNIARDAKGHVTGITVDSIQMPANPNTDTKVTSVENHYPPTTDNAAGLSANASSTTSATWGSTDLVTGVSLTRDAAGHVTGLSVSSIQMPANPNTDTDTHYTSKNVICASDTGTANATATNGSVYLNHLEQSSVKSSHKITGSGATTVTTDASGNITISSTNTTYSFSASNPTLAWGAKTKIGTIGGVDFHVTMPANPDTGTTDSAIPIASIEALS